MDLDKAAGALQKLGHPTRLCVFKMLATAGTQGVSVGELKEHIGIPASTLSHHLAELASVGLIKQRRDSRHLYCTVEQETFALLLAFLQEACHEHEHLDG